MLQNKYSIWWLIEIIVNQTYGEILLCNSLLFKYVNKFDSMKYWLKTKVLHFRLENSFFCFSFTLKVIESLHIYRRIQPVHKSYVYIHNAYAFIVIYQFSQDKLFIWIWSWPLTNMCMINRFNELWLEYTNT